MVGRTTKNNMITIDEVADQEIAQAHEKGYPEPDFDYRNLYKKGEKVNYVRIIPELGIKELLALTVQSVFARTLIAFEPKSTCHVLGYRKRDYIFKNRVEALELFESVDVKEVC